MSAWPAPGPRRRWAFRARGLDEHRRAQPPRGGAGRHPAAGGRTRRRQVGAQPPACADLVHGQRLPSTSEPVQTEFERPQQALQHAIPPPPPCRMLNTRSNCPCTQRIHQCRDAVHRCASTPRARAGPPARCARVRGPQRHRVTVAAPAATRQCGPAEWPRWAQRGRSGRRFMPGVPSSARRAIRSRPRRCRPRLSAAAGHVVLQQTPAARGQPGGTAHHHRVDSGRGCGMLRARDFGIGTGDRRFAGRIDLGQQQRIDTGQHRGEFVEQVAGARSDAAGTPPPTACPANRRAPRRNTAASSSGGARSPPAPLRHRFSAPAWPAG